MSPTRVVTMRSVTRLLLLALFGLLLVMPALPACSTPSGGSDGATAAAAVQTTTPPAPTPGATTAPGGVDINAPSEGDADKSRRKLVMGVISAVLIAIVIWGRSVRRKKQKKAQSATTK